MNLIFVLLKLSKYLALLLKLKSTKVLEAGKHWIYVTGKPRSNVLFNIDKIRQWQIDMTKYIESPERDIEAETQISNFED